MVISTAGNHYYHVVVDMDVGSRVLDRQTSDEERTISFPARNSAGGRMFMGNAVRGILRECFVEAKATIEGGEKIPARASGRLLIPGWFCLFVRPPFSLCGNLLTSA
jgi:hypothetical protein